MPRSLQSIFIAHRLSITFIHPDYDTLSEFHANEGEPHITSLLVDVLAASIKAFTLVPVLHGENTCILVKGLAERKTKELPQLERLIFEGYDPLGSDTKDALKASGMELGFGPQQEKI